MAAWLEKRLPKSARVLVSPAQRAQQTARALTRRYETVREIGTDADARAVLKAAGWPEAEGTVVVVGHQPTLGQAAALALTGKAADWSIKKGAAWWLESREGDDVINLAQGGGNDVVRYTSVLDGHDIVNGFSSGAVGPDVFDLDGLFDSLGVATSDRAARVQIVDNGPTVDVNIDVDGSGTFGLTAATLVTPNPVTVGTDPGNHVQLGTL